MSTQGARLDLATLVATVHLLAERLERHREELNRLNVYPVPDGDTGDNLLSTLRTVLAELPSSRDHDEVPAAIARGALLGGRGSSGVILGQGLRAFVEALPLPGSADGLATALEEAASAAQAAVADPVEGTILTVARDAARQARVAASYGSMADVVSAASAEGRRSLARTPDLLPVLARAGVVDAGGLGYVLFLDALAEAVAGICSEPIELAAPVPHAAEFEADGEGTDAGGRYEVICLVEAAGDEVAALRERWLDIGDTVAIAGSGRTWRCHVHTDEVVTALAAVREAGEISDVEITDLVEQSAGEVGLHGDGPADGGVSIVAVAEGDGLVAAYLEAGAHRVVTGGATAKPSTGELLRVIDACGGPVVVLTGDKDVVPAAERALEHSTVPGHLVAAGMLAGLLALEEVGQQGHERGDTAAERIDAAARAIVSADIQRAVRPARTELGEVVPGDWLALGEGGLVAVAPTAPEALLAAAGALVTEETSSGLLAVDIEAPEDDPALDLLRATHPRVGWRLLRANRRASAYGVAVR